ncbi:hypothetical protein ABT390_09425 [Streptomyces aurantiacus]|uniref:Secreted protein n=1 Tax=Streptomyces aurantiacus JA 4570 TaxID=1286094 RepID=S3ZSL2_9ACTN|nr:hypothetical protein [Streptomyces aurantiacus]EPH46143.1 hypothetical protein STRAU_0879 [Streptomyces aurantiacus JA 4570]
MRRAKAIAGIALVIGVAVPTSTAVAISAKGGGVTATSPWDGDNGLISVYDGSDDGDPGKAEYYRQASPGDKRTLWNHSGFKTRTISGDGSKIIKFKACDDNDWDSDDCSAWKAP